jgi:hypothetical protein
MPDYPTGKSMMRAELCCFTCPAPLGKIFWFSETPNHWHIRSHPVPHEGRFAIVTDAGWDAVDVDAPITNGVEADGEVVWS